MVKKYVSHRSSGYYNNQWEYNYNGNDPSNSFNYLFPITHKHTHQRINTSNSDVLLSCRVNLYGNIRSVLRDRQRDLIILVANEG